MEAEWSLREWCYALKQRAGYQCPCVQGTGTCWCTAARTPSATAPRGGASPWAAWRSRGGAPPKPHSATWMLPRMLWRVCGKGFPQDCMEARTPQMKLSFFPIKICECVFGDILSSEGMEIQSAKWQLSLRIKFLDWPNAHCQSPSILGCTTLKSLFTIKITWLGAFQWRTNSNLYWRANVLWKN